MSRSHGSTSSSVFSASPQPQQQLPRRSPTPTKPVAQQQQAQQQLHSAMIPTRSMEAVLTPLQDQVRVFTSLPSVLVVDTGKRQSLVADAQHILSVLSKLQRAVPQIPVDNDVGLTAGVRHRIGINYDSAMEHAEELVTCLRQPGPGTAGNSIAVDPAARASQALLTSVTCALYEYDQTIVNRIEMSGQQIARLGEELSSLLMTSTVPSDRLQDVLKSLSETVVVFAQLTEARCKDLKDPCQKSDMEASRITMEHCFRTLMSSIKVMLQHTSLSICRMNCLAVNDNFMDTAALMKLAAGVPYDRSTWRKTTPLAQGFEDLEELLREAGDHLSIESKKEQFGKELCTQLDAIILHAKQIAESPRTGDRAGDRLLHSCDDAVGHLSTLLQLASEDEDNTLNGIVDEAADNTFSSAASASASAAPLSRTGSRRSSSTRGDRLSFASSNGSGIMPPLTVSEAADALSEAVVNLRKLTHMALSQHTAAALAQMHRDRSLVDYLHENAAVRNNAKTTEYSSQLLRQVERFEEVVTAVCSISTDLANVLRAKRSLSELRILCPQAVAAAHALFQFPASKATRANMMSFEHAWHVEVDQLMSALSCLGPTENVKQESQLLDRSKSASMHALSGPRLSSASMHRTSSINSFANFKLRLQQRKGSDQLKGRLYASQPDVHFSSADL
eukprot:scpid49136/ scgid5019/ Catenin alpha